MNASWVRSIVRTVLKKELSIEVEHEVETIPGGEQEITTEVTVMLNGDVIAKSKASEIIGYEEY